MTEPHSRTGVVTWIGAGVVGGAFAAVAFAALHAAVIVPVWDSVLSTGSIIRATAGGGVAAWAAFETPFRSGAGARRGFGFGVVLWCLVVPATLFGVLASLLSVRSTLGGWEMVIELVLTIVIAGFVAHRVVARTRTTVAWCLAGTVHLLLLGGPFPLTASRPALGLLLGLLPIYALAGWILFTIVDRMHGVARHSAHA